MPSIRFLNEIGSNPSEFAEQIAVQIIDMRANEDSDLSSVAPDAAVSNHRNDHPRIRIALAGDVVVKVKATPSSSAVWVAPVPVRPVAIRRSIDLRATWIVRATCRSGRRARSLLALHLALQYGRPHPSSQRSGLVRREGSGATMPLAPAGEDSAAKDKGRKLARV
jgi:hypothetical protein